MTRPERPTAGQRGPKAGRGALDSHPGDPGALVAVLLPWPPTVNTYYRHVVIRGSARVLLSAAGRAYQQAAGLAMKGLVAPPTPHAVRVVLHAPDRRAYDIDNRAKALLDGIYRALKIDDAVIDRLTIERGAPTRGGLARVWIEEAAPAAGGEDGR